MYIQIIGESIQTIESSFQSHFSYRYAPFGRSFFSPDLGRRRSLGEGLETWRGFYQSIRPTQMGLSLNIGKTLSVSVA